MTRADFELRVKRYRRVLIPIIVVQWIFLISGPVFIFGLAYKWFLALFGSEGFAFWLIIMLLTLAVALPMFLVLCIRKRYGLVCPNCHYPDRHGRYMHGVLHDGHCPRCKMDVLTKE